MTNPTELEAVDRLLTEYLTACASHPAYLVSDLETELAVIAAKCREWEAKAESELPGFRPHSIATGLLLLREQKILAKRTRN